MLVNTKFEVGQRVWFYGLEGIEQRKIEEIVINVRGYYSIWYYFEKKDNEKGCCPHFGPDIYVLLGLLLHLV